MAIKKPAKRVVRTVIKKTRDGVTIKFGQPEQDQKFAHELIRLFAGKALSEARK